MEFCSCKKVINTEDGNRQKAFRNMTELISEDTLQRNWSLEQLYYQGRFNFGLKLRVEYTIHVLFINVLRCQVLHFSSSLQMFPFLFQNGKYYWFLEEKICQNFLNIQWFYNPQSKIQKKVCYLKIGSTRYKLVH